MSTVAFGFVAGVVVHIAGTNVLQQPWKHIVLTTVLVVSPVLIGRVA